MHIQYTEQWHIYAALSKPGLAFLQPEIILNNNLGEGEEYKSFR